MPRLRQRYGAQMILLRAMLMLQPLSAMPTPHARSRLLYGGRLAVVPLGTVGPNVRSMYFG